MEIKLNHIGIIENSEIVLDGLTVIAGKNESGKTTVGKALYSLLDAVSDLGEKAERDRNYYIFSSLKDLVNSSKLFRAFRALRNGRSHVSQPQDEIVTYPALETLSMLPRLGMPRTSVENLAHSAERELHVLLDQEINETGLLFQLFADSSDGAGSQAVVSSIKRLAEEALSQLEKLFYALDQDPQLIRYTEASIRETLSTEFFDQIQPIGKEDALSIIQITEDDEIGISAEIKGNRVLNGKLNHTSLRQAYLIDDPYVLDRRDSYLFDNSNKLDYSESDTFFNPNFVLFHSQKIGRMIHRQQKATVLEQTLLDAALRPVRQEIDKILPGSFEFSSDGNEYYIRDGKKLRLSNLAAGAKMFSILRILLDAGNLNETTMLILDEPETHLHPMWQNRLAEIIVLLVRELRVRVLLTTHSSNFLLALDANMRRYHIEQLTNFYQTKQLSDCFVTHECVNDNISAIYQDFLEYLAEAKILRDSFLSGGED